MLSVEDEFNCLMQPGVGCAPKVPDILIVNSGLHDANMPIPKFANNMRTLAKRLRQIADMGTKVRGATADLTSVPCFGGLSSQDSNGTCKLPLKGRVG